MAKQIVFILTFLFSNYIFSQQSVVDSLLSELEQTNADSIKLDLLIDISYEYFNIDISQADFYIEKIKEYSIKSQSEESFGKYYVVKGFQSYKQGKLDSAMVYYNLAAEKFNKINFSHGLISLYNNMGVLNQSLGRYHEALTNFQDAYLIIRTTNQTDNVANCLKNIGAMHHKLKNYQTAQDYCEQSIEIATANNQQTIAAKSLIMLGNIAIQHLNYDLAMQHYFDALSILKKKKDLAGIATCEINIGSLYIRKREYDPGMKFTQSALEKFEQLNDKPNMSACLNSMGVISVRNNNISLAISFFERSLILQKEFGSQNQITTMYKNLSEAYSLIQNYEEAYLNLKNYTQLHDSIFNAEKHRAIAELETQYKTERNKKTIELQQAEIARQESEKQLLIIFIISMVIAINALAWGFFQKQKANKEIQKQKAEISDKNKLLEVQKKELQSTNATKDKMFSIIAHDLRGPIGSLKSFVDLLADNNKILETKRGIKYLKTFQNSANSTFTLLDNLLFWAKSQQGSMDFHPTEQSIKEIIEENHDLLVPLARQKEIDFIIKADNGNLARFDKTMIGIVVRNLMANALKFTPSKGTVEVTTNLLGKEILITVKDTGVGIPLKKQDTIFDEETHYSTIGTGNEKGSGLGLILCKEFVKKNNGRIWFNSSPGKGSEFCFTIPIP